MGGHCMPRRTTPCICLVCLVCCSADAFVDRPDTALSIQSLDLGVPPDQQATNATDRILGITNDIKSWQAGHQWNRSFVTLTFAQSLDGKIATRPDSSELTSSNLPLSGPESRRMTHALRSIHDAILIGGRTLSIDNPRLTNRLWRGKSQPLPVVLDSQLNHVRKLGDHIRIANLVVCCSHEAASKAEDELCVQLLPCRCTEDGRLDLQDVMKQLWDKHGVRSIMVEGGASILSAFLRQMLVDCLCITIAPILIGNKRGLAAFADSEYSQREESRMSEFLPLGRDCIFLSRTLQHQCCP